MFSDLLNTPTVIAFVVGVVLPAVVALVTKELASSQFKNTVLIALSALSAVLIPLLGSTEFDFPAVLTAFVTVFGTSILTYLGVYKPQGTTAAIQQALPNGLGTPVELPDLGDPLVEDDDIEVVEEGALEGGV